MRPFKPTRVAGVERDGDGAGPAGSLSALGPERGQGGVNPPAVTAVARRVVRAAIVPAALVAAYVALLAPLLPVASESFALAGVYSTDEELSGRIVERMVRGPTLDPSHFFAYGALYHELSALVAWPLVALGAGERGVILALRAVALAGGAATLALTYMLGARLYGRAAGLAAAALLACSAELAGWSVTAHPDTVQLALITGALVATCGVREGATRGRVALAAALAGLAFATKYGGITLLPLILLAAAAAHVDAGARGRALLRRIAVDGMAIGVVAIGIFLITNPYAAVEWRRFITQVRFELEHARAGHVFADERPRPTWVWLVAEPRVAGPLLFLAAVAGGIAVALGARRRPARAGDRLGRLARLVTPRTLVLLWTAGSFALIVAYASYYASRYALPILPGMAVLAAGWTTETFARRRIGWSVVGALVGTTALLAVGPFGDLYRRTAERAADVERNPRILAGRWLEANLTPAAAVLTDAYIYVPDRFAGRAVTFGLTEAEVQRRRPVVVVVNDDIRGRFGHPEDAGRYVDGEDAFRARAAAYAALEAGTLGCYALVQDFGGVRIYADRAAWADRASNGCALQGSSRSRSIAPRHALPSVGARFSAPTPGQR